MALESIPELPDDSKLGRPSNPADENDNLQLLPLEPEPDVKRGRSKITSLFEDKIPLDATLPAEADDSKLGRPSNPTDNNDILQVVPLEPELKQITISQVPKNTKKLPDKKLLKIIARLFRRADEVNMSDRIKTGMLQIKYRQDTEAETDLDFVLHSYGWRLKDDYHLIWRFRLVRRVACNPNFPLYTDSFKISYLPPDIKRSTLRYIFPHVRSIAISNKRVKNRLIECLKFNIWCARSLFNQYFCAEAVLKFRDPLDANENYEHAKNLFMDKIPVQVLDEHQGKLLIRQRAVTITNIPERVIADCITAFFDSPCDITSVQIHKSPDKSVGPTAKVWFWSHARAKDAMSCPCLPKIAPLWYEWIMPQEIKISEINPGVTNKCIIWATKEILGRNIRIAFQRSQKSIIVIFRSIKAARQGFKHLTKDLKWSARNDRNVISEFSPVNTNST